MTTLTVLTLNLRATADRWHERFPMIIDAIHAHQPDIIALQEVRLLVGQAHLIAGALNYRTPDQPYAVRVAEDWYEPHILGNALLSRLKVLEYERIELKEGYRIAQRIRIECNGKMVDVACTHLHHKPLNEESIRLQQMQQVCAWLLEKESRAHALILMGDLNAKPDSETIDHARSRLQSAYEAVHGHEPAYTFPTPLRTDFNGERRTIDYIFADKVFAVINAQLVGDKPHADDPLLYPSDHLGLVATLQLAE